MITEEEQYSLNPSSSIANTTQPPRQMVVESSAQMSSSNNGTDLAQCPVGIFQCESSIQNGGNFSSSHHSMPPGSSANLMQHFGHSHATSRQPSKMIEGYGGNSNQFRSYGESQDFQNQAELLSGYCDTTMTPANDRAQMLNINDELLTEPDARTGSREQLLEESSTHSKQKYRFKQPANYNEKENVITNIKPGSFNYPSKKLTESRAESREILTRGASRESYSSFGHQPSNRFMEGQGLQSFLDHNTQMITYQTNETKHQSSQAATTITYPQALKSHIIKGFQESTVSFVNSQAESQLPHGASHNDHQYHQTSNCSVNQTPRMPGFTSGEKQPIYPNTLQDSHIQMQRNQLMVEESKLAHKMSELHHIEQQIHKISAKKPIEVTGGTQLSSFEKLEKIPSQYSRQNDLSIQNQGPSVVSLAAKTSQHSSYIQYIQRQQNVTSDISNYEEGAALLTPEGPLVGSTRRSRLRNAARSVGRSTSFSPQNTLYMQRNKPSTMHNNSNERKSKNGLTSPQQCKSVDKLKRYCINKLTGMKPTQEESHRDSPVQCKMYVPKIVKNRSKWRNESVEGTPEREEIPEITVVCGIEPPANTGCQSKQDEKLGVAKSAFDRHLGHAKRESRERQNEKMTTCELVENFDNLRVNQRQSIDSSTLNYSVSNKGAGAPSRKEKDQTSRNQNNISKNKHRMSKNSNTDQQTDQTNNAREELTIRQVQVQKSLTPFISHDEYQSKESNAMPCPSPSDRAIGLMQGYTQGGFIIESELADDQESTEGQKYFYQGANQRLQIEPFPQTTAAMPKSTSNIPPYYRQGSSYTEKHIDFHSFRGNAQYAYDSQAQDQKYNHNKFSEGGPYTTSSFLAAPNAQRPETGSRNERESKQDSKVTKNSEPSQSQSQLIHSTAEVLQDTRQVSTIQDQSRSRQKDKKERKKHKKDKKRSKKDAQDRHTIMDHEKQSFGPCTTEQVSSEAVNAYLGQLTSELSKSTIDQNDMTNTTHRFQHSELSVSKSLRQRTDTASSVTHANHDTQRQLNELLKMQKLHGKVLKKLLKDSKQDNPEQEGQIIQHTALALVNQMQGVMQQVVDIQAQLQRERRSYKRSRAGSSIQEEQTGRSSKLSTTHEYQPPFMSQAPNTLYNSKVEESVPADLENVDVHRIHKMRLPEQEISSYEHQFTQPSRGSEMQTYNQEQQTQYQSQSQSQEQPHQYYEHPSFDPNQEENDYGQNYQGTAMFAPAPQFQVDCSQEMEIVEEEEQDNGSQQQFLVENAQAQDFCNMIQQEVEKIRAESVQQMDEVRAFYDQQFSQLKEMYQQQPPQPHAMQSVAFSEPQHVQFSHSSVMQHPEPPSYKKTHQHMSETTVSDVTNFIPAPPQSFSQSSQQNEAEQYLQQQLSAAVNYHEQQTEMQQRQLKVMEELKKVKEERDFYHSKLLRVKEKVLQASDRSWSRTRGTSPNIISRKTSPHQADPFLGNQKQVRTERFPDHPTKDCGGYTLSESHHHRSSQHQESRERMGSEFVVTQASLDKENMDGQLPKMVKCESMQFQQKPLLRAVSNSNSSKYGTQSSQMKNTNQSPNFGQNSKGQLNDCTTCRAKGAEQRLALVSAVLNQDTSTGSMHDDVNQTMSSNEVSIDMKEQDIAERIRKIESYLMIRKSSATH